MFAEICATAGIAAKLYRSGRTLHGLLGLGVEDKDASDQHSKLSKYCPNSQRGQLIKPLSLLIIDEASMMQRVLFEHVDTILKDLRCPPRIALVNVHISAAWSSYLHVTTCSCCRSCHLEEQSCYQTETYRSYHSHYLMSCPGNPVYGNK